MPGASVVIPCFNRAELALRAIKSVINQSYQDFELIVVNDGSTEDYSCIEEVLKNSNHIYLSQDHCGVSAARNAGIKASTSQYVFLLDSDDEWLSHKLETQINFFKNKPNSMMVQTNDKWVRFGKPVQTPRHLVLGSGDCFMRALSLCCMSSSSVGFNKSVFDKIGYYNEKLRICEDYDFSLRALLFYELDFIETPLVIKYSGTHEQLSNSEIAMDRYRVYSLVSLLRFIKEQSIHISLEKLEALYQVLKLKSGILSEGAAKRGIVDEALIYKKINSVEYSDIDIRFLDHTLHTLENTLNFRSKFDQI